MDSTFFINLWRELRRSLTDTLNVFDTDDLVMTEALGNVLSQLIVSALLVALVLAIYVVVRRLMDAAMRRMGISDEIHTPLLATLRYLLFLVLILTILAQFGVEADLLAAATRAALIALLFYVAWAIATRVLLTLLYRYQLDRSIEQLLRNVVSVLIVVVGAVTVLAQFGFDILSVVAGLGIVGLAVGFAAQSTLSNFIAGITILIERPFRIGDWVMINGQEGQVMRIALRTTWLRTRDNIFTMIPNDSVASSDIINYSTEGALRVRIPIGIAYKESIRAARDVILPIMQAHPDVLQVDGMQPKVVATALGNSSVDLILLYWVAPERIDVQPRISAELLERAKEALDAAGIQIPFPHLQLFIDAAEGLRPVLEPLYPQRDQPPP